MTTVNTAPRPDGSPAAGPGDRRRRLSRLAVVALLIAIAGMWLYAFSPFVRRDPPGELQDPTFSRAAEPICARTAGELEDLPPAHESPSPEARAETIRASNAALAAMLADLRRLTPTTPPDEGPVDRWLDDWEVYLGDRDDLADRLAQGEDARLHETPRAGDHISEALDFFADVNGMPSCMTPHDVA